jgi:hypothetical protein
VTLNVEAAVADDGGDDTWSAAFSGGSSAAIVSGAAAAQNTKVRALYGDEATTAATDITLTPNGGSFTAGAIRAVAYYFALAALPDAT